METLGEAFAGFSKSVVSAEIEQSDIDITTSTLQMIVNFANELEEVGKSTISQWLTGGTSVQTFAGQLATLGENLKSFMDCLVPFSSVTEDTEELGDTKKWDFDTVVTAMYALNRVADAAKKLGMASVASSGADVTKLLDLLDKDKDLGTGLVTFIDHLKVMKMNEDEMKTVNNAMTFFKTFAEALGALKGVDIGNIIQQLTRDILYDAGANRWKTRHDNGNGLAYFVEQICLIYRTITTEMKATNSKTKSLAIDTYKVKVFFDLISDFFSAVGDLIVGSSFFEQYSGTNGLTLFKTGTLSAQTVMQSVIDAMQVMVDNVDVIFKLIDALGGYLFTPKLETAQKIMDMITEIAYVLRMFSSEGVAANSDVGVFEGVENLKNLNIDDVTKGLKQMIKVIRSLDEDKELSSELHYTGRLIAGQLIEGMQQAFDSDEAQYHPKITPVLELTKVRQDIASIFGVDGELGVNFSSGFSEAVRQAFGDVTTFSTMSADIAEIKNCLTAEGGNLSAIKNEIGEIKSINSGIVEAFNGTKIYLDAKELVDAGLGPAVEDYLNQVGVLYTGQVANPHP